METYPSRGECWAKGILWPNSDTEAVPPVSAFVQSVRRATPNHGTPAMVSVSTNAAP